MNWQRALGTDVNDMVALTQSLYEQEIDEIYTPDTLALARNLLLSIVKQFYNPNKEYVAVLRKDTKLVAYVWLARDQYTPWSDDEVLEWKIAHLDLSLSARERVAIVNQMIDQAILFAHHNRIPVIASSTVRNDQAGFLRIHEKRGFTIRGSVAYLRLAYNEVSQPAGEHNNDNTGPL